MPFLTPKEVADDWNVSYDTVKRLIRKRELPAHKLGKSLRISPADKAAFEAQHRLKRKPGRPVNPLGSKEQQQVDLAIERYTEAQHLH